MVLNRRAGRARDFERRENALESVERSVGV